MIGENEILQEEKRFIPTCNILGVNIAAINMKWLIEYLIENLDVLSGDYICVSNVHTTVMSCENENYCKIQNGGLMAIPDGGPLSKIGRKWGYTDMSRITGPDLMEEVFNISLKNGYRHYFYGSTQETLDKLLVNLNENYPNLNIVGMYSPPFRALTSKEEEEILKNINSVNADFIWIGLGAPKQEEWMHRNKNKVKGLMIGVGAGFDYFAGNISRAPKWMQENSLEWFYRLIQDPKRLFKRYLYTNTKFIWNLYIMKKYK